MSRVAPVGGLHLEISLPHRREWELYHNGFSLCSKKVRMCMAELGLDFESHHIDLIETGSYQNASRRYLAVNRGATVPVLVHNGHPVYESHMQILYAEGHAGPGAPSLRAEDPESNALIERWSDCASIVGNAIQGTEHRAGHCIPGLTLPIFATMIRYIPYREIFRGLFTHPYKERPLLFALLKFRNVHGLAKLGPAMKLLRQSRAHMTEHLDRLEHLLQRHSGPWIAGERFTLADVSWVAILDRLVEVDWDSMFWGQGTRPAVTSYWQRLCERPSYKTAIETPRCAITRRGTADLKEAKRADVRLQRALEVE